MMRCPTIPTVLIARRIFILNTHSNTQNLEHPGGGTSEYDHRQYDNNEDRGTQSIGIVTCDPSGQGYTDGSSETSPEEHHLIRVR
jgi:hypothetical protein